ncbi:MAG: hypothetical protein ACRDOT_01260 [Aeromicrobium sp.]
MRIPTVAAAILVVALAGCGGTDEPNVREIKAGDCIAKDIADEDDRAPDFDTVVDCSKPHVYEILAVIDIPKDGLAGKSEKERLANRDDLASLEFSENLSAEKRAFIGWAETACDAAWTESTGMGDITLNGVSAEDARVLPAVGPAINLPWFNVASKKQWLAGNRQLICSARFVEPGTGTMEEAPPVKPISSTNDEALIAAFGAPTFPAALRSCDGADHCDQQHHSETLFLFDAQAAMDENFVSEVNPKKPTDQQLDELARVCAESLPALLSEDYDKSTITSEAFIGMPWEQDYYMNVGCEIVPSDSSKDFGPGSLIWTDAKDVELVDAK